MIMDMQKLCIIVIVSFLMLFSHISKQMYNNVQHSQNKCFANDVDCVCHCIQNYSHSPQVRENQKGESMRAHGLESSLEKFKAPHTKTDKESI